MRLRELIRGALGLFSQTAPEPAPELRPEVVVEEPLDRVHGEDEILSFVVVENGHVLSQAEHHFRDGSGLRTIRTKGRVVTRSGEIVPAEQLLGICVACGGYESVLYRCCRCDRVCCGGCVCRVPAEQGEVRFCLVHYLDYLENLNTWRLT